MPQGQEPPHPDEAYVVPEDADSIDPDERTAEEAHALELGQESHERHLEAEELSGMKQARHLRWYMFALLVVWVVGIFVVVILDGVEGNGFDLDAAPVSTAIFSGALPIAAILLAILGFVFSSRGLPVIRGLRSNSSDDD